MTADAPLYQSLRPSVMRVVRLAARGYSDPAIARELHLSLETVQHSLAIAARTLASKGLTQTGPYWRGNLGCLLGYANGQSTTESET
jgi:hypothetical protein